MSILYEGRYIDITNKTNRKNVRSYGAFYNNKAVILYYFPKESIINISIHFCIRSQMNRNRKRRETAQKQLREKYPESKGYRIESEKVLRVSANHSQHFRSNE